MSKDEIIEWLERESVAANIEGVWQPAYTCDQVEELILLLTGVKVNEQ